MDPTLEALKMFDDPTQWVVVPNVPMMVPHERRNSDGTTKYKVGPQRLQAIVATMEAVEQEDGVLPKIQVGHTVKGGPEPEILGYIRNRRVDPWGPKQKLGALGDLWFMKDKHAKAAGLPFRSSEFYPDRNQISALALLARDPELDMGMVLCERGDNCEFYHLQEEPSPMSAKKTYAQAEIDAAMELYERSQTPVVTPPAVPVARVESDVDTMIRLAREESAVEMKRQSDQIARLETALAAEQYARSSTVSENAVKQLQLEGYVVKNVPNLVKKLAGMNDETRSAELSEIRENYSRAPLEQPVVRTAAADNSKQCSREDYEKAVSMATSEKLPFDAALAKVRGIAK